jgi:hypothetical protein
LENRIEELKRAIKSHVEDTERWGDAARHLELASERIGQVASRTTAMEHFAMANIVGSMMSLAYNEKFNFERMLKEERAELEKLAEEK